MKSYKVFGGTAFWGRRLNLLEMEMMPRRFKVAENGGGRSSTREDQRMDVDTIVGLYVDVKSSELEDRLRKAVAVVDRRIEDLALRAELGKVEADDLRDHGRPRFNDDLGDLSDLPPRKLKAAVQRRLDALNDAKTQIQFLADHVVPDVVYRLDMDDARRLATIHVDLDA